MRTVSVIIPNYNRERLIGETLECLLRQTHPPHEIIVVDDGSTDGSVELLKRFGNDINLIVQDNSGPAAARNRGLRSATSEYVQFFDSDDLCSLNKLETQVQALETSGADVAYGPWIQVKLDQGKALYSDLVLQSGPLPKWRSALSWFMRDWAIIFQSCMFRRSLLGRLAPYRTDLMPTEDSELLFRILKDGARWVHTADCLVLYRLHDGGQISQGGMQRSRRARDWLRYAQVVSDQLGGAGEQVAWPDRLAWAVVLRDAQQQVLSLPYVDRADIDLPKAPPGTALGLSMLSELKRINRGTERRIRGSAFGSAFNAKPLTPAQADMISALGYEPVFSG